MTRPTPDSPPDQDTAPDTAASAGSNSDTTNSDDAATSTPSPRSKPRLGRGLNNLLSQRSAVRVQPLDEEMAGNQENQENQDSHGSGIPSDQLPAKASDDASNDAVQAVMQAANVIASFNDKHADMVKHVETLVQQPLAELRTDLNRSRSMNRFAWIATGCFALLCMGSLFWAAGQTASTSSHLSAQQSQNAELSESLKERDDRLLNMQKQMAETKAALRAANLAIDELEAKQRTDIVNIPAPAKTGSQTHLDLGTDVIEE